jgi:hypothetical protein
LPGLTGLLRTPTLVTNPLVRIRAYALTLTIGSF